VDAPGLAKAQAGAAPSPKAASTAPGIRVTPDQADASSTVECERKTVAALFADIRGSKESIRDLDPEQARAIIDPGAQAEDRRGASF
jgi:class 3 adenylate cyclase